MSKKPQRQHDYDDADALIASAIWFDDRTRIVIRLYGDPDADNTSANNLYRKICQLVDREINQ